MAKGKSRTDRQKIASAFSALRKAGYSARLAFGHCRICGVRKLPESRGAGYVFYSVQEAAVLERGNLPAGQSLFLCWRGDADQILKALTDQGLSVRWDGTADDAIEVYAPGEAQNVREMEDVCTSAVPKMEESSFVMQALQNASDPRFVSS